MQKKHEVVGSRWVDLFVFVLFANLFLFHSVGIVALVLMFVGVWILRLRLYGPVRWYASGLMLLMLVLMFLFDSPEKIIILTLTAMSLLFVSVYTALKQDSIRGLLELCLSGLSVIRAYLWGGWDMVKAFMVGNLRQSLRLDQQHTVKTPWMRSVLVGLLVGLPVVGWLAMTLASADPVFGAYLQHMVSEQLIKELPWRLAFSAVLLLILTPLPTLRWRGYRSPLGWLTSVSWAREMSVITGMIVVVLGVFLVVQWPYVFASVAAETDLSRYGVATYSEYVQRGFGDLIKVVLMVFTTAWVGVVLNKNQTGPVRKILLWMQGLLALEFVVFVVSIFRRVWLYQIYHGLTLARLYGLALLVLMVGMSLTMALRYIDLKTRWVKVEMAWIVCVVVAVLTLNMESLVIKRPPTVNNRIDYVYLSRLPGDGKEGWLMAYTWANQLLQDSASQPGLLDREARREIFYAGMVVRHLMERYHTYGYRYQEESELSPWDLFLSWSWAERQTYLYLRNHIERDDLLDLQNLSSELQTRIGRQPRSEQEFDMDISLASPFLR